MDEIIKLPLKSQKMQSSNWAIKNRIGESITNAINWLKSFTQNSNQCWEDLFKSIRKGKLSQDERWIAWYIYLNILPYNSISDWKKIMHDNRSNYWNKKSNFITKDVSEFIKLPFTKGTNEYESYRKVLPLKIFDVISLIKLDVNRTYQEHEIFRNQELKEMLITILYIYYRYNSDIGYIQGMNEILAILCFTFYPSITLPETFPYDETSFLYYIITPKDQFFEPDWFVVFNTLMNKDLRVWFSYSKYRISSWSALNIEEKQALTRDIIFNHSDSEIKKRMYLIFYNLMKSVDPELYEALVAEVDPDTFLLRWLLCVFTREFEDINKVLKLWDLILSYEFYEYVFNANCNDMINGTHWNYIEYICLSMFYSIRREIISDRDGFTAWYTWMHYPEKVRIETVIENSVKMCVKLNGKSVFK